MDRQREQVLNKIDDITAPAVMGWKEAKTFLEELAADIDARIEALKEENEDPE